PADAAGGERVIAVAIAVRAQRTDLASRGEALVDENRIVGHGFDELQRQPVRIDRRFVLCLRYLLDQRLGLPGPVLLREPRHALPPARRPRPISAPAAAHAASP